LICVVKIKFLREILVQARISTIGASQRSVPGENPEVGQGESRKQKVESRKQKFGRRKADSEKQKLGKQKAEIGLRWLDLCVLASWRLGVEFGGRRFNAKAQRRKGAGEKAERLKG
jgi:hypothetical protein